jgi:hypothetical protein
MIFATETLSHREEWSSHSFSVLSIHSISMGAGLKVLFPALQVYTKHTCSIIYYTEKGKQEISKLFVILEIFCLESQMQKGMYIGIRGSMFSFKGKALIVGT